MKNTVVKILLLAFVSSSILAFIPESYSQQTGDRQRKRDGTCITDGSKKPNNKQGNKKGNRKGNKKGNKKGNGKGKGNGRGNGVCIYR
jgi:hypothetical protein